ncbi:MAG: thiamine diphosphokinase [Ignavibacteriae bacterium HGW-Ignavibacteriae-4]|jgi:thiamine pyrophosphokinase|nr:MAG: thiamine diphosphokinase [Ignavibacteriae bacterium HGW-Ignavibacteriae-4]
MNKYIFKNKKFDLAICLNGEIPSKEIFDLLGEIPLIAADGAYNALNRLEIHPMAIVGDMDSVEYMHDDAQTSFVKIDSQETNDFEKCIEYIADKGYENILIVGFTGGLLEHAMNNTSILMKYSNKYDFTIYHEGRYSFLVENSSRFQAEKGEIISLIPYPIVKLTTKNLYWELNDELLELGTREGARNIATSDSFSLEIHSGKCFVFIDSRLPLCPEKIL